MIKDELFDKVVDVFSHISFVCFFLCDCVPA